MGVPDRSRVFRGTCPCGTGELHILRCTPDHGWPTATPIWYEAHVNCRPCSRLYILEQRGNEFVLVERARLETQQCGLAELRRKIAALMSSDEVKEALGNVVDLLRRQSSKAAVFRLLNGARLFTDTQSSFYRHWSGPERWVDLHVNSRNIHQYLDLASISLPNIQKELRELHRREADASMYVDPVGMPVYVID